MFTASMSVLDPRLRLKAERLVDPNVVQDVLAKCDPLAGILPDPMVREQAAMQRIGHQAAYPSAMRCLIALDDEYVGRVTIDWDEDRSHCVDIALEAHVRGQGIGTSILSTWLSVAARFRSMATLSVQRGNPAIALYLRLGLIPTGDEDGPMVNMTRGA